MLLTVNDQISVLKGSILSLILLMELVLAMPGKTNIFVLYGKETYPKENHSPCKKIRKF